MSESSRISVVTKGVKQIVKDVGMRLNVSPRVRENQFIILLSFYLLIVMVGTYMLSKDVVMMYLKANKNLFSLGDTLTRVDGQYRSSLQVYYERFLLLNSMIYTEAWGATLTSEQFEYRKNLSLYTYNTAVRVFGTNFVFDFLTNEIKKRRDDFSSSIKTIATNPLLSEVDISLSELILRPKLMSREYEGLTDIVTSDKDVPLVAYLLRFQGRLESVQRGFQNLKQFGNNKAPPWGVPDATLTSSFRRLVPDRFSELRNAFNGFLAYNEDALRLISKLTVETGPKKFNTYFFLYIEVGLALVVIYSGFEFWHGRKTSRRLFLMLAQYQYLTREELRIHLATLTFRKKMIKEMKYDEFFMINNYLRIPKSGTTHIKGTAQKNIKILSDKGRAKVNSNFKHDFRFKSTKFFYIITFLTLLLIGFVFVFLLSMNLKMNSIARTIDFYSSTYQKFTRTSNHYFYHSIFSIFGNFIRVNGEFPQVVLSRVDSSQNEVKYLINHLIDSRHKLVEYYGEEGARELEPILFQSICNSLDKARVTYKNDLNVCNNNLAARSGFISFMTYEIDVLKELRDMVNSNPDFCENSKTNFNLFPFQTYLFMPSSLNFRVAHKLVFERTFELLLNRGTAHINKEVATSLRLLNNIGEPIFYSCVCALYLLIVFGTVLSLNTDTRDASETLLNLIPEIIVQNKLVYKVFSETFISEQL